MRVAALGECMIELREGETSGALQQDFGGDTYNTAVYMARLLGGASRVAYLTALGRDRLSDLMAEAFAGEGFDVGGLRRIEGRLPGLYWIRTEPDTGERSFLYWRGQSAARAMLTGDGGEALLASLDAYDLVYLSGITLAILPEPDRDRLLKRLEALKAGGRRVAFDPNYRPMLWPDAAVARETIGRATAAATIVLPSFDDEAALFGDRTPEASVARLRGLGVAEIALKRGAEPGLIWADGVAHTVVPIRVERPRDTTGAGDSFNAAYLVSRLNGQNPAPAADAGNRLAARVVMHQGGVIPKGAMPVG